MRASFDGAATVSLLLFPAETFAVSACCFCDPCLFSPASKKLIWKRRPRRPIAGALSYSRLIRSPTLVCLIGKLSLKYEPNFIPGGLGLYRLPRPGIDPGKIPQQNRNESRRLPGEQSPQGSADLRHVDRCFSFGVMSDDRSGRSLRVLLDSISISR